MACVVNRAGEGVRLPSRPRRSRRPTKGEADRLRALICLDLHRKGIAASLIGAALGITPQCCRRLVRRAEAIAREHEAELEARELTPPPPEAPTFSPMGGKPTTPATLGPGTRRYLEDAYGSDPTAAVWLQQVAPR